MTDQDDTGGETGEPEDSKKIPPPPGKPGGDPRFTQDDVDGVAAKSRKAGASGERKRLLDELGIGSVNELTALIEEKRQADEAQMTEAQKARAEADAEKAKAEAERTAARRERLEHRLARELLTATGDDRHPILTERVDPAVRFVIDDLLASDDEDEALAAAGDRLRDEFPEWFIAPSSDRPNPGTPGTPPRRPNERRQTQRVDTPKSRAAEAFKQMKSSRTIPFREPSS